MPDESAPPLEVDFERRDGATIVAFSGELDMAAADQAAEALRQAVSNGSAAVMVDLQGLRFMDSTGFYCLWDAATQAGEAGIQLVVLTGSGPARRVLQLTGADEVIQMVDDLGQLNGGQRRVAG